MILFAITFIAVMIFMGVAFTKVAIEDMKRIKGLK